MVPSTLAGDNSSIFSCAAISPRSEPWATIGFAFTVSLDCAFFSYLNQIAAKHFSFNKSVNPHHALHLQNPGQLTYLAQIHLIAFFFQNLGGRAEYRRSFHGFHNFFPYTSMAFHTHESLRKDSCFSR